MGWNCSPTCSLRNNHISGCCQRSPDQDEAISDPMAVFERCWITFSILIERICKSNLRKLPRALYRLSRINHWRACSTLMFFLSYLWPYCGVHVGWVHSQAQPGRRPEKGQHPVCGDAYQASQVTHAAEARAVPPFISAVYNTWGVWEEFRGLKFQSNIWLSLEKEKVRISLALILNTQHLIL